MTRPPSVPVPQWPTVTATLDPEGGGEINLSPSIAEPIAADTVDDARILVLERVAAYAQEKHGRAVRLKVRDPTGEWLLAVNPDGTVAALEPDPSTTVAEPEPDPNTPAGRLLVSGADDSSPPPGNGTQTPAPPVIRVVPADRTQLGPAPAAANAGQRIGASG